MFLHCSAATDIKLIGAEWPLSDFEDSGGAASGSWNKLSPGATVRVEYFLTPKTSGAYAPLAAKVTYNPESDAQTQVRLFAAAPAAALSSTTDQTSQIASITADRLWRNPNSLHPLTNAKANEDSPQYGKLYAVAELYELVISG